MLYNYSVVIFLEGVIQGNQSIDLQMKSIDIIAKNIK